jgi:hypothetical protein
LQRGAERESQLQFVFEAFMSFGQAAENVQSGRQMLDCLARGAAAKRVARSLFAVV